MPFSLMFSGTDVSGKNSLMHEMAKVFNYRPFMSPRSPICNIVYDKIYKRNKEYFADNFKLILNYLRTGTYFILIQVDPDILVARASARDETHVTGKKAFEQHIKVYNKVFNLCKTSFPKYAHRFIKIDNSGLLEDTVTKLKEKLGVNDDCK